MADKTRKKQSLLGGAMVLMLSTFLVEVVGVVYKIPLTQIIGTLGRGYTGTAFNIYIPVYNIAMAGLPVAISKLVSQHLAEGKFNDVRRIFKVARNIFFLTGAVGTLVLVALASPYCRSISSPESLMSVYAIAPAVFVCCMMSTYRGYYSGLHNQTPQAVSEICEAVGKMVFGLVLSYLVTRHGFACFEAGEAVYGVVCATREDAVLAMTPWAAAASITGVTMGAVCSLVFLMLRHAIIGDRITHSELEGAPTAQSAKALRKALLTVAIPIVVSTLVMNLTTLIDSWSIQFRLQHALDIDPNTIRDMYRAALVGQEAMSNTDLKSYIYGAYEIALDFRNLIPAVTTSFGLSAIPVMSEAWTLQDHKLVKSSAESVVRLSMLISLPMGFGMAAVAQPLLVMLYGPSDSVTITAPIMAMYGVLAFVMAVSQPVINMLQGIGRADIPMKSLTIAAVVKIVVNFVLVGIPQINIKGAVIGTIAFFGVALGINLVCLLRITHVRMNFVSVFFKPLICTIICAASAWGSNRLFLRLLPSFGEGRVSSDSLACVLAILAAVIVYVIALLLTRSIAADDVKMLPKGEKICKTLEKFGFIR